MNDLPPLAWAALCAIVMIIVVMNLALVAIVRHRSALKITPRPSRQAQSMQNMGNMITILRDPFAEERKQIDELSGLIQHLDDETGADGNDKH